MQEQAYIRNHIEGEISKLDKFITGLVWEMELTDESTRPVYYSRLKFKLEMAKQDKLTLTKRLEEYGKRHLETA